MITLLPEKDNAVIKKAFEDKNIEYNENAGMLSVKSGDEMLGFCLYFLDSEKMTIAEIEPKDDIMLVDGIVRSTIHIASERFILDIRYSENIDENVFEKIGFIKDKNKRTLDADKLFGGCACHNN
ncbi:MAG: hypothetical protein MJ090_05420 [Clostridia bacterium]|nr:hypothetical protein [Clostridia bacterium]